GMRLINFSRNELVDNAALLKALDSGTVACYVTDFPSDDLLGHKNIITIPHLGASTPETEDNCAVKAAQQLREFLLYGNIKNSVNFPDCDFPMSGRKRVCVAHRNVVNVVGPVTSALAGCGFNIDNMVNKSKGNYAYTVIEVDGEIKCGLEAVISGIESVLSVRVI
ncbi:MAG: 3-phosphoglycerate dehydrogenase, partial [Defluviitaleaceae bacterium]|nr:3-phosphoglycerate dehydrogenase [Defluviitaleaceae bacterium]